MSTLEFISSLKWPITVLILCGFFWRRIKRNPNLRESLKEWIKNRDIRLSVAGSGVELSQPPPDAAAIAASSDEALKRAAGDTDMAGDPAEIRRDAIETIMTNAAHWGWQMAKMGFNYPPNPAIQWNDKGIPEIQFGSAAVDPARRAAIQRRLFQNLTAHIPEQRAPEES